MSEEVFRWVVAAGVLFACLASIFQAIVVGSLYRASKEARQAGKVAAAGPAGPPGAGAVVPPAAVRAGVGEQHLAAGAGEGPRDPPGEHPPAAVGRQAAGAVPARYRRASRPSLRSSGRARHGGRRRRSR